MAATTLKRKSPAPAPAPTANPAMPPIRGLNHWAYRCRDAEETRHFYEDILGLPLACVIKADHVPSTGEYCPYVHIFFEMADGSFVAFFDLGDDTATVPDPATPSWVNHLALQMASVADVEAAKRLSAVDLLLRSQRRAAGADGVQHDARGDAEEARGGARQAQGVDRPAALSARVRRPDSPTDRRRAGRSSPRDPAPCRS